MKPDFSYEQQCWAKGYQQVIGVDEIGRGAIAGPVVAGAVVLPSDSLIQQWGINDSKKLSVRKREDLSVLIKKHSIAWAIGEVCNRCIDRNGIVHSTARAIRQAVSTILSQKNVQAKCYLLTDAFAIKHVKDIGLKDQQAIVRGDQQSLSIAAGSIIAKVYRDDLMRKLSVRYTKYHWEDNKGYGTIQHMKSLYQYSVSPYHRKSFAGVYTAETTR